MGSWRDLTNQFLGNHLMRIIINQIMGAYGDISQMLVVVCCNILYPTNIMIISFCGCPAKWQLKGKCYAIWIHVYPAPA